MIHRTQQKWLIHSQIGLNNLFTKMLEWFTVSLRMIHRKGINDSFSKQTDWFTHKLDWMTNYKNDETIYRTIWMIDSTGLRKENAMISWKWNDWVTHKLERMTCLQNQMNGLFVKWSGWIILKPDGMIHSWVWIEFFPESTTH